MDKTNSTLRGSRFIDLAGQRFGQWTVIDEAETPRRGTHWNCVCDCGNKSIVFGADLRRGTSTRCISCGNTSHGLSKLPEYKIWLGMRCRCECPTATGYSRYGGRRITVCDEWHLFEAFYRDIGPRPSPKHTIERIDNALGYSKENCCWATRTEQMRNMGRNHLITFRGKTQCLQDWAAEMGTNKNTLRKRLKRGWSVERALTCPARSRT